MLSTPQQFEQIRDEAWKADHADAMECRTVESLIENVVTLWNRTRADVVGNPTGGSSDRAAPRDLAAVLRAAEQTLAVILERASRSVAKGYSVHRLAELIDAVNDVRLMIARPMARMMAARDPEKRTVDDLAQLFVRRCRFQDGRPVVTSEVGSELPCPFEPEPAM